MQDFPPGNRSRDKSDDKGEEKGAKWLVGAWDMGCSSLQHPLVLAPDKAWWEGEGKR